MTGNICFSYISIRAIGQLKPFGEIMTDRALTEPAEVLEKLASSSYQLVSKVCKLLVMALNI